MRVPVVTDIALAHRFSAPPCWQSDEYAAARSHHGIIYAIDGAAFYRFGSGKTLWLRAGDVLYAPIGSVYTIQCAPEEGFLQRPCSNSALDTPEKAAVNCTGI